MKPKKLVRSGTQAKVKQGECEIVNNKREVNKLYSLKIKEELKEVENSNHKDITEFADLLQVVYCFANQNGISKEQLDSVMEEKANRKGVFSNIALNSLNPNNPSNAIYFDSQETQPIAKRVLLEELNENSHPENVEDVIFWALEYYAENRKLGTFGEAIAYSISNRILEEEKK